jgi:hypothetical protein
LLLQHALSSTYMTLVNQGFPEELADKLHEQVDAITQL